MSNRRRMQEGEKQQRFGQKERQPHRVLNPSRQRKRQTAKSQDSLGAKKIFCVAVTHGGEKSVNRGWERPQGTSAPH